MRKFPPPLQGNRAAGSSAYLGRLVDIHVALISSVPYYTVYATPLAGYLRVERNVAPSQWRVFAVRVGHKARPPFHLNRLDF